MKKNMIIFILAVTALFIALILVVNYQNKLQSEGNPFEKNTLHSATIEQLDDPNYQNQVLPDELSQMLANGEDTTIYFYSPICEYCLATTPVVVPMTDDLGIDLKKLNVLEFEGAWDDYNIEGTPTIIHFEDGEEVARISGSQEDESFKAFFEEVVLGEQAG